MTINDQIRELAANHYSAQIASALNLTVSMVNGRLARMGIKPLSFIDATRPTDGEWIGVVQSVSEATGIAIGPILSGSRLRKVTHARWLAFKTILEAHPEYTIAGLARTSGFHHSSIMHGLSRLAGALPNHIEKSSRATKRRFARDITPTPDQMLLARCKDEYRDAHRIVFAIDDRRAA